MALTAFGLVCRQHRIRIGVVMADQSTAIGVPTSFISAVERGAIDAPDDYVAKLIVWMQLDRLEALQLNKLSRLHPKWPKKQNTTDDPGDLRGILNRLAIEKRSPGHSDEKGTTSQIPEAMPTFDN